MSTTTIVVSGLPNNVSSGKVINRFRGLLGKAKINKFWLKDMAEDRSTGLKTTTVELYSVADSLAAIAAIEGSEFYHNKSVYMLSAEESEPGYQEYEPPRKRRAREDRRPRQRVERRERERSNSPYRDESSKLDFEIELLRKKRIIIEEERRLLLEKKKLELLKEVGPSALKELESYGGSNKRRFEDDHRDFRPRRHSPEPYKTAKRPRPTHQDSFAPKREPPRVEKLPNFYAPCNKILGDMRDMIKTMIDKSESFELYKVLRTTLRKRLVLALSGINKRLNSNEIVAQYRLKHPEDTDEALVKKLLDDIKACNLTNATVTNDDWKKEPEENWEDDSPIAEANASEENTDNTEAGGDANSTKNLNDGTNDEKVEDKQETADDLNGKDVEADKTEEKQVETVEIKKEIETVAETVTETAEVAKTVDEVPESTNEGNEEWPEGVDDNEDNLLKSETA